MQAGRLRISNHPANRQVAAFIGDFNVLEQDEIAIFGHQSSSAWAIHPESIGIRRWQTR
jgi:ABC-type Fe3+/spermidine/putrescine transport system ATPase subunit